MPDPYPLSPDYPAYRELLESLLDDGMAEVCSASIPLDTNAVASSEVRKG